MKLETTIDLILKISEKFEMCDKETVSQTYFEVLHCALDKILSEYSQEQFDSVPDHIRSTILKLEQSILTSCSEEYINKVAKHRLEHGFYSKSQDNFKKQTKNKQKIGFVTQSEGLNV